MAGWVFSPLIADKKRLQKEVVIKYRLFSFTRCEVQLYSFMNNAFFKVKNDQK